MSRTLINPLSTIEWSSDYSFSRDPRGLVSISLKGSLSGDSLTASDIVSLIPANPPASIVGSRYSNAKMEDFSFDHDASGFYELSVNYKGSETTSNIEGDPGGDVEYVRYRTVGITSEASILSHPAFDEYAPVDQQRLKSLLNGDIVPNPIYDPDDATTGEEYVSYDENGMAIGVTFGTTGDFSPYEMASRISKGITTYLVPSISHSRIWTQQDPLPVSALDRIATIYNTIGGIDTPTDRNWLLMGFSQENTTPNAYEISADWQLSAKGGCDAKLYAQ